MIEVIFKTLGLIGFDSMIKKWYNDYNALETFYV